MAFHYELEPGRIRKKRYDVTGNAPLISIITPYYNAGKYFEQTFNSVMNQTFPWYEWIIVDDGSTDQVSIELLKRLSTKDARIKLYSKGNSGPASTRNYAVQKSGADLLFMMDSDDLIESTTLEVLYFTLYTNQEAVWSYPDIVAFQDQQYLWSKEFSSGVEKEENIVTGNCLIRKKAFDSVGGYAVQGRYFNEDWHLWLKFLSRREHPVHVQLYLFWYRISGNGALCSLKNDVVAAKANEKIIDEIKEKVPDGIRAITFNGRRAKEFEKPKKWAWERKLPFAEEKIRILMLIPHMECGGADKFNLDIIKNIDKSKYEIGVITTNVASNEWRQRFYEYADDVFELPAFLDMNDWSAFVHYYIYTRNVQLVCNISSYYGYYLLPWLRVEFPETAVIDCVHAEGKYWRNGGYPRVSAAMDGVLEKTFVTNAYTRDIMVERYGKKKENMQVIYTGVDENEFDPKKVDCVGLKEKLGIAQERPIVLYLCRIAAEKRPFLMLEIAKKVKKQIPGICFLCVGEGPQLEELKRQVHTKGLKDTVLVLGGQADVKPYYKLSDLLLLCSLKEGLSITTMEAMAMGTPVVSADVGSQYELVMPETGRLVTCQQDEAKDFDSRDFPEQEIEEYAEVICELLNGRTNLAEMGRRCREKVLDGFTLSCLMNDLYETFDQLLLPSVCESRAKITHRFSEFRDILEDYLTLYITYEAKDREAAEIWGAREWYRELYETTCNDKSRESASFEQCASCTLAVKDVSAEQILFAEQVAQARLREIYSMRTWRLMEKYMRFMDKTKIGRVLSKVRNLFLRNR